MGCVFCLKSKNIINSMGCVYLCTKAGGVWSQRSCGKVECMSMVAGYAYAEEMARVAFSRPERIHKRLHDTNRGKRGGYSRYRAPSLNGSLRELNAWCEIL
jgi:Zn-finger nucleic acid-binding protein